MRDYMRRRRAAQRAKAPGLTTRPVKPSAEPDAAKDQEIAVLAKELAAEKALTAELAQVLAELNKAASRLSQTTALMLPEAKACIAELELELAQAKARITELEAGIDPATFSKSARERFEAMRRRQAREFEDRVKQRADVEARRLLNEIFLPDLRKRLEDNERQNKHLDVTLNRHRPIISKRLLRLLHAAAHSDRSGSHELAVAFNTKRQEIEIALCGKEADRPERRPMPTLAEMMANRAAYDAENRERAKRAAATRAARKASKPSP